jgi:hypothetical protein
VAIAHDGSLLVADDVGNTIWRVRQETHTARSNKPRKTERSIVGTCRKMIVAVRGTAAPVLAFA